MILLAVAVAGELGSLEPPVGVERQIIGVGPVEAACSVAAALARGRYSLVINAGVAGAFNRAAEIGDSVVVADDTMELSLESGAPLALPLGIELVEKAESDATLVAQLCSKGFPALHGVTVTRVTASAATARRLSKRGAQVESMEGFAVLRAARRAGVPAIQLRGISNRCGERKFSGWDFAAGAAGVRRILDVCFELVGLANVERL